MYKYYKEVINFSEIKAISNCLKYFRKEGIEDEVIFNNVDQKDIDLSFIKEFLNTSKFLIIKKKYDELSHRVEYYNKFSTDELWNKFLKCSENNVVSYLDVALILNELYKKMTEIDNDVYLIKYLFYFDDELTTPIDKLLADLPADLSNVELKTVVESKFSLHVLGKKNLETFNDIKDINVDLLILLVLEEIEKFSCFCETYFSIYNEIEFINEKIKEHFWKANEIIVFEKRYSINGINQTLEEISNQLGITRERVRQISNNIVQKIKKEKEIMIKIIFTLLTVYKNESNLLELEVLKKYLGETNVKYYLALLLDKDISSETLLNYNENYRVIYHDSCLEQALVEKTLLMDYIIFFKDIENYSIFERQIIKNKYKRKNNYYIKTNVNKSIIYCNIIDELFPDGCKIHDVETIRMINEKYFEIYGIDEKIDSRILETYVNRENYCMIDRGTFLNKKFVPIIDDEFIAVISDYIYDYNSVYYSQIFENFRSRFYEYNITNWYYVKGIINIFLGDEFVSKKAYIQIANSELTPIQEISKFVKEQNSFFSFDKIKENFPGVKNNIIYNILYSIDDLILLSKERFVLFNKIVIEPEDRNLIKENVEYLFRSLNSKIISTKKLHSRMKILYSSFFEKYNFIIDDYSLFSLLKNLFKDEYYFYRPFIGKEKINSNSSKGVIINYLMDYEKIKISDILRYIKKMNIRHLSIDEIFEITSDYFVQIDKETLVKKELLFINKYEIEAIDKFIKRFIYNNDKCYISNIRSYINLPNLKYTWNKYFLLGIIRSYLKNEYSIIETNRSNNYLNIEFEIRRNRE